MDAVTHTQTSTQADPWAIPQPMLAQASPPQDLFPYVLVIIFLIFYVLVIRPNTKAQKAKDEAIASAAKGDEVVTVGGIHGKVLAVEPEILEIEVAKIRGEKVKLRVERQKIDRLEKPGAAASEKSEKGKGGAS